MTQAGEDEFSRRLTAAIERDRHELPDVVALVRDLLAGRDVSMTTCQLSLLGPRARDGILRALAEEAQQFFDDRWLGEQVIGPYSWLVGLLGDPAPAEAEPWLLRYARSGVPRVRRTALGALAGIGTEPALDVTIPALGDADPMVVSAVLRGLALFAERDAVPRRHRDEIVPRIETLLAVPRHAAGAVRLLAALDPNRAAEFVRASCATYPAGDVLDAVLSGVPASLRERLRGARDLFDELVVANDWRSLREYVRVFPIAADRLHALARSLAPRSTNRTRRSRVRMSPRRVRAMFSSPPSSASRRTPTRTSTSSSPS